MKSEYLGEYLIYCTSSNHRIPIMAQHEAARVYVCGLNVRRFALPPRT